MQKPSQLKRMITLAAILFLIFNMAALIYLAQPALQKNVGSFIKPVFINQTPQPITTLIPIEPSTSPTFLPTPTYSTQWQEGLDKQGTVILSMRDGIYYHLFAYHPLYLPMTRLTNGQWDDVDPAISPDGKHIAYTSNQNGYWDIYILDLDTRQTVHFTDTPEYDGGPTWSPDGQWLAYESYIDSNLDILIRSVSDGSQAPIRLTSGAGMNFSPAWSPQGRDIAFTSDRSGEAEIWTASLDRTNDRFTRISHHPEGNDNLVRWSPDGSQLAWVYSDDEQDEIVIKEMQKTSQPLKHVGNGDLFVWSPLGDMLLTRIPAPNQTNLGSYLVSTGEIFYPPVKLAGSIRQMDWKMGLSPNWISQQLEQDVTIQTPAPALWQSRDSLNPPPPGGRSGVAPIPSLSAPYPYLHDSVDESYVLLRQDVHKKIGWNFLDTLENAFQPMTEPPPPGMGVNWLFTGRAFAVNPTPYYANWMVIVRENIGGQIYWRIYLKPRFQDGSLGEPLRNIPWNFNARYTGDPQAYENGGTSGTLLPGYWVDFTDIAINYGWKRLPALSTWRTYFESSRFNQYYMDGGVTWEQAMQNIYPPEALATQTYVPTRTITVTPTVKNFTPSTPTPTSTITLTPTLHPTWTPAP